MSMSVGSIFRDRKHWRYTFYYDGRSIRAGGFSTRTEAGSAMKRKKDELKAHGGEIKKTGFLDAYDQYLGDMAAENAPGWFNNKKGYRNHFEKHFENDLLHTITEFDVQKYKHKRKVSGSVKTGTIDRELAVLKHFFKWAKQRGYCSTTPAAPVKKYNDDNRRGVSLTENECARLIEAAAPALRARLLMALGCGLRHGEIANLMLTDIDPLKSVVRVERLKKRHRETDNVSITPELVKLLLSIPHGTGAREGYVFEYQACRKSFSTALIRAGIDQNVRFHDLRHTAATWQLQNDAAITAIQKFLGHRDITTTMRYLHVDDEKIQGMSRSAIQQLQKPFRLSAV